MKEISAEVLGFLLGIEKEEANKKIVAYLERKKGNDDYAISVHIRKKPEKYQEGDEDKVIYGASLSADVEGLQKYLNVDLEFAISNIRNTYLTSPTTRGYIMNYPAKKLIPNKKTRKMPRKVGIPKVLRSLLTIEDQHKIVQMWEDKFYTTVTADPVNDVKFSVT